MFHIRPETSKDQSAIREVNLQAFEGDGEVRLVASIRGSRYFDPELSLVAEHVSGKVIGHILFSIVGIETETGMVPTLALAPMAVLPDYQNQGIGSALVQEGLRRCGELGYKHVVVLGHPNFYPKFGFVPASTLGIKSAFPVGDEYFMVYELTKDALDGVEGKVKYPPAFDAV